MTGGRGGARPRAPALACLAAACLVLAPPPSTAAAPAPAGAAARGRWIYLKGEGGEAGEITAVLAGGIELPAASLPCAGCHGPDGAGSREGGLAPPAITRAALGAPRPPSSAWPARRAYDEAAVARAIRDGIGPDGAPLDAAMPRYRMAAGQLADLIAYLGRLGDATARDPGLSGTAIRVGAALPVTGPLASVGRDVQAAIEAAFAEVNGAGGVYGRALELVVEDSAGTPGGSAEATRRLVEAGGVFALVGSLEPAGGLATARLLERLAVPLVGPVTLSPRPPVPPDRYVFYLLPTFGEQARVLVDFVATRLGAKARGARLAVVRAGDRFGADWLAGAQAQAARHGMEVADGRGYEAGRLSASAAASLLAGARPAAVLFLGGAADLEALAAGLERAAPGALLLGSALTVGRAPFTLPARVASRTFLAHPQALSGAGDPGAPVAVMRRAGVEPRSLALQAAAYAAAKVLAEALKQAGRQVSRESLVAALERLHDVRTGVLPPLTFGPGRRVGLTGSYVVGVDQAGGRYVPSSGWLEPKDGS